MTDYGHDLLFGSFITPTLQPARHAVDLTIASEHAGLDLATFQDHPYQGPLHDPTTLLTYAAPQTERIHLAAKVDRLHLRHPLQIAHAAAPLCDTSILPPVQPAHHCGCLTL